MLSALEAAPAMPIVASGSLAGGMVKRVVPAVSSVAMAGRVKTPLKFASFT